MPIIPLIIAGAAAVGGIVKGAHDANQADTQGNRLKSQGQSEADAAFKARTNLNNTDINQSAFDRANLELGDSTLQDQEISQANAGASQAISAQKRLASSSSQAILAASSVQDSVNAQKRQAVIDGASQRNQKLQQLNQAGQNLTQQKNLQYQTNVDEPFLIKEQIAQDKIGLGLNTQMAAMKSQAAAWQSGLSSISSLGTSAYGGGK